MEQHASNQEEITIKLDGGTAENHEVDAAILGSSLLAFSNLVQHTNSFINGKDSLIVTKVKGGFKEGSFEFVILLKYFGAIVPLVPQVVQSLREIIEFKKFLAGTPPKHIEKNSEGVIVENNQGNTIVVHNNIYAMNNSASINVDMGKFFKPLEEGITSISLQDDEVKQQAIVQSDQKQLFLPSNESPVEQEVSQRQLEILTPNMDGKSNGWRFYDLENDVEFTASMDDNQFLQDVRDKKYNFQSGDVVTVTLAETRKMVNQRKRTERVVTGVMNYQRPTAA